MRQVYRRSSATHCPPVVGTALKQFRYPLTQALRRCAKGVPLPTAWGQYGNAEVLAGPRPLCLRALVGLW